MTERHQRQKNRPLQQSGKPAADPRRTGGTNHPVEKDPAVERGERIHTGKTIARGGKETGHVPGTNERPPNRHQEKPSP
jgi:hypothetical protein